MEVALLVVNLSQQLLAIPIPDASGVSKEERTRYYYRIFSFFSVTRKRDTRICVYLSVPLWDVWGV